MQSSAELLSGQVVEAVSCECKLVSRALRRGSLFLLLQLLVWQQLLSTQAQEGECDLAPPSLPCDSVGDIHLWGCLESGFVEGGNARTGVLAQSRGSELRFGVLWLGFPVY